jgi:gas vesicle GvpC-like protein
MGGRSRAEDTAEELSAWANERTAQGRQKETKAQMKTKWKVKELDD